MRSAPGRDDSSGFDHEDYRAFRCAGAVANAFRHDEAFARPERDHTSRCGSIGLRLEVDEESTVENKEELVVFRVLVPMILPLHDAEPDDRLVDAREGLIIPRVLNGADEGIECDLLERPEENVQIRCVRKRARGLWHDRARSRNDSRDDMKWLPVVHGLHGPGGPVPAQTDALTPSPFSGGVRARSSRSDPPEFLSFARII